jgi:hypothetical protein
MFRVIISHLQTSYSLIQPFKYRYVCTLRDPIWLTVTSTEIQLKDWKQSYDFILIIVLVPPEHGARGGAVG